MVLGCQAKWARFLALSMLSLLLFAFLVACGGGDGETKAPGSTPTIGGFIAPSSEQVETLIYTPPKGITTVTLPPESYMRFAKGGSTQTRNQGDMLVSVTTTGFFFYALAERSQGGVQDLGELPDPVDKIEPPTTGYIIAERVDALVNRVYAVKSRDDEPGHFIIVRVKGFGEEVDTKGLKTPTITLEYFYR